MVAMRRVGHELTVVPQHINFFTNTTVDADVCSMHRPIPLPLELLWSSRR